MFDKHQTWYAINSLWEIDSTVGGNIRADFGRIWTKLESGRQCYVTFVLQFRFSLSVIMLSDYVISSFSQSWAPLVLSRPRKSHTGGRSRNDPGFNLSAFLDHVWVTQEEVKAHSLSHRRNVFPWSQGEVWVLWVFWCLPLGQTQPRREIPVWADLRSSAWRLYFVILRKYAPTPLSHRLSRTHKLGLFWPWSRQNFVWELKK